MTEKKELRKWGKGPLHDKEKESVKPFLQIRIKGPRGGPRHGHEERGPSIESAEKLVGSTHALRNSTRRRGVGWAGRKASGHTMVKGEQASEGGWGDSIVSYPSVRGREPS